MKSTLSSLLKVSVLLLLPLSPTCSSMENQKENGFYQSTVIENSNAIAISWLKDQLETSPKDNICLASFPLVILSSALAIGSEGNTASQLWQFAARSTPADFNESNYLYSIQQLNRQFKKDIPGYCLYNGLYVNKNMTILDSYKEKVEQNIDMETTATDFSNPGKVASQINHQIQKHTNGLVKNGLSPVNIIPDSPLLMINVLGFTGKWENPFDKELTREDTFYPAGKNKQVKVPFMQSEITTFRETEKYTLLWLNYAQSTARLVIILPEKNVPLTQLIREMSQKAFHEYIILMNSPQKKFGNYEDNIRSLSLPKFEFSTPFKNSRLFLEKEGITDCFTLGKAYFPRMMQPSYNIKDILQKCYLKIDEEGTKAYAITFSEIQSIGSQRKELKIDRPFLCFIIDSKTNMIFFTSVINDPLKNF